MANTYDVGDQVRFTATFAASGGALADPSYVFFLIKSPTSGAASHRYGLTPSAIVRTGVGAYYVDVTIDSVGNWPYRWQGTGGLQIAEETAFAVRPTFTL